MDVGAYAIYRWTNKDTFAVAPLAFGRTSDRTPTWLRIGEDGGGNIVADVSLNGVSWSTIYSAAIATAWGSGGATTGVGPCIHTQSATGISGVSISRVVITP